MERLNKLYAGTQARIACFVNKHREHVNRPLLAAAVFALGMSPMSPAFATGDVGGDITAGIKTGAQNVYSILRGVVLAICACVLIWAAIKAAIGDQRDMDMLKKTFLTVVIVVLISYLAPAIMKQIGGWFETYGWVLD